MPVFFENVKKRCSWNAAGERVKGSIEHCCSANVVGLPEEVVQAVQAVQGVQGVQGVPQGGAQPLLACELVQNPLLACLQPQDVDLTTTG